MKTSTIAFISLISLILVTGLSGSALAIGFFAAHPNIEVMAIIITVAMIAHTMYYGSKFLSE